MSRPTYYPPQHSARLAAQMRGVAIGLALLSLLCCGLVGAALVYQRLTLVAAIALAMLVLFIWASTCGLYDNYRHIRIIPYFERKVGNIETYTAGHALARYCGRLDELAKARGQTELSAFGFHDDLRGETLVWHAPAEGLQTVGTLQAVIRTQMDQFDDPSIASDLQRLSEALQRANEQGTRFCLLLLHGCGTSGHEWDVRQGSAF